MWNFKISKYTLGAIYNKKYVLNSYYMKRTPVSYPKLWRGCNLTRSIMPEIKINQSRGMAEDGRNEKNQSSHSEISLHFQCREMTHLSGVCTTTG